MYLTQSPNLIISSPMTKGAIVPSTSGNTHPLTSSVPTTQAKPSVLEEELRKLREMVTQQAGELAALRQQRLREQEPNNPLPPQIPPTMSGDSVIGSAERVTVSNPYGAVGNSTGQYGNFVQLSSALSGVGAGSTTSPPNCTVTSPDRDVSNNNFDQPNNGNNWRRIAFALCNKTAPLPALEKPAFRSIRTHHPVRFLQRFDAYFNSLKVPFGHKLGIVKSCVKSGAFEWLLVRQMRWKDYEDFRTDFLSFFWSKERQHAERNRISKQRYSGEKSNSMSDFFLRQVSNFQLFTPPLSEYTIVSEIMRQFPCDVQSLWAVSPTHTFYSALQFLERQSATPSKHSRMEGKQPTFHCHCH